MITPAYSPTATERVLPRMALDFTTASLDSRVTVTRALNTATRVNSSGLIASVNANLPRFDFDPVTLTCKGLLIEESRANIPLYSEDIGQTYWTKANATVSTASIVSPSGTTTVDKIVESSDVSGQFHYFTRPALITVGQPYTASIFAQAGERTQIAIQLGDVLTYFNLSSGTVVSGTGIIQPFGNGWYRCIVTTAAAANGTYAFYTALSGSAFYTGNGTSGLYVWGAQLELGAFATSYIPTTSTSLTRNADAVSMTGTNLTDWYNSTESTLVFVFQRLLLSKESYALSLQEGNTTNIISFIANADNTLTAQVRDSVAGVTFTEPKALTGGVMKVGIAAAANNTIAAWDGVLGTQDTTVTMPSSPATVLNIGFVNVNYGYLNGYVRQISYWGHRITNAELQAFTK